MIRIEDVLVKPVQTEKSVGQESAGKYTFLVHIDATKSLVAEAVKKFFGADVKTVNITKMPAKFRIVGRGIQVTRRRELKKAVVTLPAGKTLDFNAFK